MSARLFLLIAVTVPVAAAATPVRTEPPRELFRHYALSTCLAHAFPAVAKPAQAAANAYFEFGSGTPDAYRAVDELAAAFLKRPYASKYDVDLGVMKCIDFAKSPEIDRLIARAIPVHAP